jgi:tRNA pseudouridine(55) synthase
VVLEKKVGETPLSCVEKWRKEQTNDIYQSVPLAYAGRLDPMASGKLLILLGEECKKQEKYHGLDKEYVFEVLFGVASDTADVLGLLSTCAVSKIDTSMLKIVTQKLTGEIELPYPHFSSKTVQGKPLHTWKLEGRIGEIEIPTKKSIIHVLHLKNLREANPQEVYENAIRNIESIPKVTDIRKAIGNDFRRVDVRLSWKNFIESHDPTQKLYIAKFVCIASSGTYMRTLSEVIARELGTCGLAYSIHRTKIGVYKTIFNKFGFWKKQF